jgi:hypothetical protein
MHAIIDIHDLISLIGPITPHIGMSGKLGLVQIDGIILTFQKVGMLVEVVTHPTP